MGEPRLPDRARTLQVLLGVGAVLVVSAAAAVAAGFGGVTGRLPLFLLALVATGLALVAALDGLRSTEESLAVCAGGLAIAASALGGTLHAAGAIPLAAVALACLGLHRLTPSTAAWPLTGWAAAQVAVLRGLGVVPGGLHPALFLVVALGGLGIALWGRRLVARVALVTAAPWWVAGVAGGLTTAWSGPGASRPLAAFLVVAAAAGLLPARLRSDLDPLLGSPSAVPLLAGALTGVAATGALAALGPPGITAGGYLGVLVATTLPGYLRGWRRGMFRPLALTAGSAMALLALAELSVRGEWAALAVLVLLTAVPTVLVAARRPAERAAALPWAVGCLAAAVLLAVPAGWLAPQPAAAVLTALYGTGLTAAATLGASTRPPGVVAAGAAAAAGLLLMGMQGDRAALALLLAAQGLLTVGWAWWTVQPVDERPPPAAWRISAALLVAAAWLGVSAGGVHVLEEYTLPLAAGLLLAQGPRLTSGPSWPTWGPGLLVAAVPSAVMAVLLPGSTRPVAVLAAAAGALVLAGAAGVRALLVVGAITAVGTALGLALAALLWPVVAALVIGAVLLAVGARRERWPAAFFGSPLANLR